MTPFEVLSEEDKNLIEKYILNYGFMYNETYETHLDASMEHILSTWNNNKKDLFKMLGNNLIVRRPYTFTIPVEGIAYSLKNNRSNEYQRFYNIWWNKILTNNDIVPNIMFYNKDTKAYDLPGCRFDLVDNLEKIITCDELATNAWNKGEYKFMFPNGEKFKISNGMRIMRIIHKFVEEVVPDCMPQYEAFRIWHSQILNNRYLDGEICLSIHPLDFMTMSDNKNNWRSCMRWTGEDFADVGDYRAGTLECMNSSNIIVAYLHSPDNPMLLDLWGGTNEPYKWNNKKWRELFIINPEIITEIKAYPYQDENLTNTILMWIKELAKLNLDYEYDNYEVNVSKDIIPYEEEKCEFGFDFSPTEFMYNDFGTLEKHRGRINARKLYNAVKQDKYYYCANENNLKASYYITIPYGGEAICMCCGNNRVSSAERVLCDICDTGYHCPICGESISGNERYWLDDVNDYVCLNCIDWETGIDDISEETHLNENLITLYYVDEYDDDERPICKAENSINIYRYIDSDYWNVFNTRPHTAEGWMGHWTAQANYVTAEDIRDIKWFKDLFPNVEL